MLHIKKLVFIYLFFVFQIYNISARVDFPREIDNKMRTKDGHEVKSDFKRYDFYKYGDCELLEPVLTDCAIIEWTQYIHNRTIGTSGNRYWPCCNNLQNCIVSNSYGEIMVMSYDEVKRRKPDSILFTALTNIIFAMKPFYSDLYSNFMECENGKCSATEKHPNVSFYYLQEHDTNEKMIVQNQKVFKNSFKKIYL